MIFKNNFRGTSITTLRLGSKQQFHSQRVIRETHDFNMVNFIGSGH